MTLFVNGGGGREVGGNKEMLDNSPKKRRERVSG